MNFFFTNIENGSANTPQPSTSQNSNPELQPQSPGGIDLDFLDSVSSVTHQEQPLVSQNPEEPPISQNFTPEAENPEEVSTIRREDPVLPSTPMPTQAPDYEFTVTFDPQGAPVVSPPKRSNNLSNFLAYKLIYNFLLFLFQIKDLKNSQS
jgi:hypothetical protein